MFKLPVKVSDVRTDVLYSLHLPCLNTNSSLGRCARTPTPLQALQCSLPTCCHRVTPDDTLATIALHRQPLDLSEMYIIPLPDTLQYSPFLSSLVLLIPRAAGALPYFFCFSASLACQWCCTLARANEPTHILPLCRILTHVLFP
jgi:hypothetical protein